MTPKMESFASGLVALLPAVLIMVVLNQVAGSVSEQSANAAEERSAEVSDQVSSLLDRVFLKAESVVHDGERTVIDPSAVAAAHLAISSVTIFDAAGFQLSRWPARSAGPVVAGKANRSTYTSGGNLVRTWPTSDQRRIAIAVSIHELERSLALDTSTQIHPVDQGASRSAGQVVARYPLQVTAQAADLNMLPMEVLAPGLIGFWGIYWLLLRWASGGWRRRYGSAEEKIQALEAELQHIRSDFLSNVAKEFLGPLSHVLGLTGTLAGRWDDLSEEKKRLLVDRIGANAESMEEMVEELMDYARIEQGTHTLLPRICSLPMECGTVLEKLQPLLREHRAVSMVPEDLAVIADPRALRRVLEILLSNAARFSPPGGLIMLRAHRSGDQVIISVDDEGPCVPAEEVGRVFDRFYKRGGEKCGPGVGLWIAKDFVSSMGGELRLETSDRGSTFCFDLPARLDTNVSLPPDDIFVGRKLPKSHGATGM